MAGEAAESGAATNRPRMIRKITNYLSWYRSLSWRGKKAEVARRIFPKARLQHHLDTLVGPIGYWDELQAYQFNVLKTQGLLPGHRLLDIGCGPLQGGLAFIRYLDAGNYAGIDVREASIAEARLQVERAGLTAKRPTLAVSGNFGRDRAELGQCDYMWACQILYHLEPAQLKVLFEEIARRLTPGGKFLGDIIGTSHQVRESSQWSGFKFHLHRVEDLRQLAAGCGLGLREVGTIDQFGYPKEISLHTNEMLELSRAAAGTGAPAANGTADVLKGGRPA